MYVLYFTFTHLVKVTGANLSRCPYIRSLPAQYPSQPRPFLSGAPEVAHHFRPVVVLCRNNLPQIIYGGDLGEDDYLGRDFPLCTLPCLLLRQATPLPLHSPSAEGCCKVPAVKGLLWHKHVALRSSGVRAVTLLQDHNCIPHVEVCKVNP